MSMGPNFKWSEVTYQAVTMSYSSGKWNAVYSMWPLSPTYKHLIYFFAEMKEMAVELEPLTQPTGSKNDFLLKRSIGEDVQHTVHRGAELREQKTRNVLASGKQQKLRIVSVKARGPCDPPNKSNR